MAESLSYVKGYVSREPRDSRGSWHVCVKDPMSEYNRQPMPVASIRPSDKGCLARGLNVVFRIGSRDGEQDKDIPCAVDVHLLEPGGMS